VPSERVTVSNGAKIKFACVFCDADLGISSSQPPEIDSRLLSRNRRRYGPGIIPRTYGPPRPLFMALVPLPCGHHFYYSLTSSSSFLARWQRTRLLISLLISS